MVDNVVYLPWVTPPGQVDRQDVQSDDGATNETAVRTAYDTVYTRLEKSLAHVVTRSDQSRNALFSRMKQRFEQLVEDGTFDTTLGETVSIIDIDGLIEELLDNYESKGWLNERRAIESFIEKAVRNGKSASAIRRELNQKGYSDLEVEHQLAEIDEDLFLDTLFEIAEKRIQQTRDLDPDVQKRRLWSFLQRRGYSGEQIRTVLTELLD